MPRTLTRADGRRRRDSLLDAALVCFSEEGILATGIEQIRRRAGASPSSMYHHFAGLDDLTAALLTRTFERLTEQLTMVVEAAGSAEEAVRALVRAYLEWVFEHPEEARFMFQAATLELSGTRQRDVLDEKARLFAPLSTSLRVYAERGELPAWSWPQLNAVILGPSQDACRHMLAGEEIDRAWAITELPQLAWRSLHGA